MKIFTEENCGELLSRPFGAREKELAVVRAILDDVRKRGDAAVFEYEEKFDGTLLDRGNFMVSEEEYRAAYAAVSPDLLNSLRLAIANILGYHTRSRRQDKLVTERGRTTGYVIRPVDAAGLYVPGGTAPLTSSMCMSVLPARAAGVKRISVATPAKNGVIHPLTLVAAKECGATEAWKMGGAQAIAAFAYGTESVKKVDVVAGPGNIYVTLAKKEVYGQVGVDMLAGPSEILIVCDRTADPALVAADVLSQAEHDALARAIVITDCPDLAEKIAEETERQLKILPRREIAERAIASGGGVIVVKNLRMGVEIANKIAPEHLELYVREPEELLPLVRNAGAVFLGGCTPEPVGDYFAGPDHILPTGGSAKFYEVLNEDTFTRKMSVIKYSQEALREDGAHIAALARSEGLEAHARAVLARLDGGDCK